jgi:hypothetical protein
MEDRMGERQLAKGDRRIGRRQRQGAALRSNKEKSMEELSQDEIEAVSGAGTLWTNYTDIKQIVKDLPNLYNSAIESMTDMMCRLSDKC